MNKYDIKNSMTLPNSVLERLKNNEIIARKFHEIEISILTILNFHDFIEELLSEISLKFAVPFTWVSIIEESSIAGYLHNIQNSRLLKTSTAFLSKQEFIDITGNRLKPLLANQDLERFKILIPEASEYKIGSIAIAPITLDGEIVGSFNQADENSIRFKPGIDTSLLEQLALKVSLCLSNVTAHEQLKFLAFHDPLTGLLNRGVMERILDREFQRSKRYHIDLTILFLDLDDFKSINDNFGHDNGDRALCHMANCLNYLKRDSDIVARFAGDEFVVILPSTNKRQAQNYIERVKHKLLNEPIKTNQSQFTIKVSHGLSSVFDKGMDTSAILLKAADKELYLAKKNKKKP
ncbi:MAG: sensor domain-containing diguanylate cyclase [Proteobacteria bacterium]|nr:sensor domain-containing diguanylate cyclase [Pseudomonadota bacterium]MBU1387706.1 sensor domain-containing diguanylate cyclase [Pseudomonadota bacterium]MBU1541798.1 sensor domain-containing diguanylate cyclase [Pseudomonadota bacterium]MBU2480743.1 sensor domain-containing diguanylate cyclase [Pseudomonadota bacterium]